MSDLYSQLIDETKLSQLLEFSLFSDLILESKTRISEADITQLKQYQYPLFAFTLSKDHFSEAAENRLAVLGLVLEFVKAFNEGDEEKAALYRKQAIDLHNDGDRFLKQGVEVMNCV